MGHVGGVGLPEGSVADILLSYYYLVIPRATEKSEETTSEPPRIKEALAIQTNGQIKSKAINHTYLKEPYSGGGWYRTLGTSLK